MSGYVTYISGSAVGSKRLGGYPKRKTAVSSVIDAKRFLVGRGDGGTFVRPGGARGERAEYVAPSAAEKCDWVATA